MYDAKFIVVDSLRRWLSLLSPLVVTGQDLGWANFLPVLFLKYSLCTSVCSCLKGGLLADLLKRAVCCFPVSLLKRLTTATVTREQTTARGG